MPEAFINYLAVLVAAVAGMILGALWFSPLLFGNLWVKLNGMTAAQLEESKKKGMAKSYLLAFVGELVTAYVLAHIVDYAGVVTVTQGLQAGFWIWLGFVATTTLGAVLWEGKSPKLYALINGHALLNLLLMGVILAVWI